MNDEILLNEKIKVVAVFGDGVPNRRTICPSDRFSSSDSESILSVGDISEDTSTTEKLIMDSDCNLYAGNIVRRLGTHPCRPLRFERKNGREINITEIGLRHPSVQGKRMVHIFDVTDGSADYCMEFDAERLVWHLTREADHA